MDNQTLTKAQEWLTDAFDVETQKQVQHLIDNHPKELEDSFYKNLEFGTGGMRGIMGVGTNRLNKYTIGAATQGLANYVNQQFPNDKKSVVIAHDVRHNSDTFAKIVANVLSANGIKVYLFEGFRPTPELSFAVRYLNCNAGIVLTASHNPPEYNGYKVYWNDGGQIVPPHDKAIINEVQHVKTAEIKFDGNESLIHWIGKEVDDAFIAACAENGSFTQEGKEELSIVFTSIHGTSIASVPDALKAAGFKQIHIVEEQAVPSGDFPTVESPNPEEPAALKMALDLAEKVNADIVIGTDPDADRLGIAVRNLDGELQLLNGNQSNTVLVDYLLNLKKENGELQPTDFIGSTIVTSDIFIDLAAKYGIDCKVGLTGFKWIADFVRKAEGKQKFICGGEESFGFMVGDFVRDKDSVTSTLLACEIAALYKAKGSSFYERLLNIYTENTYYKEHLISLKKAGKEGAEEIKQMMINFRENPPGSFAGSDVVWVYDYENSIAKNVKTGDQKSIDIPKSNVLIFFTEDGSKIAARPSGTEPKIKFYFSVKADLDTVENAKSVEAILDEKLALLKTDFEK